jgi:hypothetical protein
VGARCFIRKGHFGTSHADSFFFCNVEPIAQGKAKAKLFLEANPEIASEIEAKLREKLFASGSDANDDADESSTAAAEVGASLEEAEDEGDDEQERVPVDEEATAIADDEVDDEVRP